MNDVATIICNELAAGHGEPGPFSRCTQLEVRRRSGRLIVEAFGTPRDSSAIVRLFRLETSQTDATYLVDVIELGGYFRFHDHAPARGWNGDNGVVDRVKTGTEPNGSFAASLLSVVADGPLRIAPAGPVEVSPIELWIGDDDRAALAHAVRTTR